MSGSLAITVAAPVWFVELAEDGESYEIAGVGRSEAEACRLAESLMRGPFGAARVRFDRRVIAVFKRALNGRIVSAGVAAEALKSHPTGGMK